MQEVVELSDVGGAAAHHAPLGALLLRPAVRRADGEPAAVPGAVPEHRALVADLPGRSALGQGAVAASAHVADHGAAHRPGLEVLPERGEAAERPVARLPQARQQRVYRRAADEDEERARRHLHHLRQLRVLPAAAGRHLRAQGHPRLAAPRVHPCHLQRGGVPDEQALGVPLGRVAAAVRGHPGGRGHPVRKGGHQEGAGGHPQSEARHDAGDHTRVRAPAAV
mmetsp:Transcript_101956/g.263506  ORF Transcript_101956/g.263506 Transcript_101956/m.263506 type:complete len:224 (-) Transcript_101956:272-943(-)